MPSGAWRETSPDTDSSSTLTLEFPVSINMSDTFLSIIKYPVSSIFVIIGQSNGDIMRGDDPAITVEKEVTQSWRVLRQESGMRNRKAAGH